MTSITHTKRYLPHELTTRIHAVKLYRSSCDLDFVLRRYHISKASLMRWNKRYDGTPASLASKSHRPLTPHPNAHTEQELTWIKNLHRRNPNISVGEMYGKLKEQKGYTRHPGALFRVFRRLGFPKKVTPSNKSYTPRPYDTPSKLGEKWQMDVKYVPAACYTGDDDRRFFQYTALDEAERERFIYAYEEQSSYSTCGFIRRAIAHFGYLPKIIQTDNGAEFTHLAKTKRVHPMDALCLKLGIKHQRIRPRTPRHNGKVERSHRNDQERFYSTLKFYSLDDLQVQMKRYLRRSNNIPTKVLGWLSPAQKRKQLLANNPMPKPPVLPANIMAFIYPDAS